MVGKNFHLSKELDPDKSKERFSNLSRNKLFLVWRKMAKLENPKLSSSSHGYKKVTLTAVEITQKMTQHWQNKEKSH